MIDVAFLLRSLDYGGTERQVVELARALSRKGHQTVVVTFYSGGALSHELAASGVRHISLDKRGRWDVAGFAKDLVNQLRTLRPPTLYSFLDMPNLVALAASPFLRDTRIVWGARASDVDFSHYDWLRSTGFRLEQKLSRFVDLIIVNSQAGKEHLTKKGFPATRMVVVQNGIDTDRFAADRVAASALRAEWGFDPQTRVVGLVGRLDPIKGHETFLKAASILVRELPGVRFVCVGDGPIDYAIKLKNLAADSGLGDLVKWVPNRPDMPAVYSAFDLYVSSSISEGFSNVIAEAMSCEVPCVVTNVGDSALIVGDTGMVVPSGNPDQLAHAIKEALTRDSNRQGHLARSRIQQNWSLERMADQTERLLFDTTAPGTAQV